MKLFQLNFGAIPTEIRAEVVTLVMKQLNASGFSTDGGCKRYMLNGYCLFFGDGDGSWQCHPTIYKPEKYTVYHPLNDWSIWSSLKISVPIKIKLNSDYSAVVSKDDVKVGCQTFPHSVIEEMYAAIQNFKK